MSLVLGLDTATPYLSLALWSEAKGVVAASAERVEREHAARLPLAVEALLRRANRERSEIAGVVVGVGPGSYTGLRVGGASAQGLARALGVPLAGASTLAAIAARGLGRPGLALAAIDARREQVYAQLFERTPAGLVALGEAVKAPREALRQRHPQALWLEGLPPDAAYLARQLATGAPPTPQYL